MAMNNVRVTSAYPRRRQTKGRSKQGCMTCRIRRVKCDELKPDCHNCCSTGRQCDWDKIAPRSPVQECHVFDPHHIAPMSLLPMISRDYQERRSFAFFHSQTAPQLSGCFGSKFWDRLILQSMHQSPPIWHAAVALGSIHERFSSGDASIFAANLDQEQGGFALEQYNKAISTLANPIKRSETQSADVVLSTCMLFICFELMRGHHGTALSHAQSGIKIIADLQNRHSVSPARSSEVGLLLPKTPLIPIETLTTLFTRLDTQICEIYPETPENILKPAQEQEPGFGPTIPDAFASIAEARNCYDYLYNDAIHRASIGRGSDDEWMKQLRDENLENTLSNMARWEISLDTYLRNPRTHLDSKGLQAANMLKLQRITTIQMFSSMHIPGEMMWDDFTSEFVDIIRLAEFILQHDSLSYSEEQSRYSNSPCIPTLSVDAGVIIMQQPSYSCYDRGSCNSPNKDKRPNRMFSMDPGIIVPLYNTIWKCRISKIRKQGIALLKSYPRQEGVWDGVLTAMVCERIVAIEEEGIGDQILDPAEIPDWARILRVGVVFDMEERRAMLEYSKRKAIDNLEIVKIVDILHW